jgi:hypothetical protein
MRTNVRLRSRLWWATSVLTLRFDGRAPQWAAPAADLCAAAMDMCESECYARGHKPGVMQSPVRDCPTVAFVADDVDRAWYELGRSSCTTR